MKKKITRKTKLSEILKINQNAAEILFKKGLIGKVDNRGVKILGKGELKKKLEFKNCKMSKNVKKYEMAK